MIVYPMISRRHPRKTSSIPFTLRLRSQPTKFRIFFQVPYPLSPFFSHSSENHRGVGVFFPFWNFAGSAFVRENPPVFHLSSLECALTKKWGRGCAIPIFQFRFSSSQVSGA